jgi:eukaryotic-like serine/threonine-protein kinase
MVGQTIGPYHIVGKLGAGGMGEVYRARDRKLDRDVAIKMLPRLSLDEPERRARFDREARVLASLNHPNIGAIYGLEEADGVPVLVLELVEGLTLAERLAAGPMPVSDVMTVARQIVDAMDTAHERGVVHRDLKPSNVKITPDDVVKVLDFGLAKLETGASGRVGESSWPVGDFSSSPTRLAGTVHGVLLGTAPYMSPEQARGKPVDKRTDIWAFGCVLFEMLAGRPAFRGETTTDVLATILEREPDFTLLSPATPPNVARLVRRCLEKDPKRRLRDIGDARGELDEPIAAGPAAAVTRRGWTRDVALVAVGLAIGAAAYGGGLAWRRPAPIGRRDVQVQRITDFVGMEETPSMSPDGKTVAFVAQTDGRRQIWVRLLSGGAPLQITRDAAEHEQPRWTPDSSAVVYFSPADAPGGQGTLAEISALGGTPRRIGSALSGGDVSHDGRRVAVFQFVDGHIQLSAVARDGSVTDRIAVLQPQSAYSHPRWSPDDRSIAFQRDDNVDFDVELYVVPSAGGTPVSIARADFLSGLSWFGDGSGLVYSSSAGSTVLYPPTFQLRAVAKNGAADRQLTFGDVSYIEPDLDRADRLVASRVRNQSDIWRMPTGGTPAENTRAAVRVTHQTGVAQTPSLAPDGGEIVYLSDSGGHGNLWISKTGGSDVRQLTFERDPATTIGVPVWSPAGDWIAFILTKAGVTSLAVIRPDGSGLHTLVARGSWAAWSADGSWLYYLAGRAGPMTIEKIPVAGGQPVPVRGDDVGGPAPSRDGATLYFLGVLQGQFGSWGDWEIRKARPENGSFTALGRVASARVPISSFLMHMFLSPDEKWLAFPMIDGATTNIWVQPTEGGAMRPLTDFGSRPVVIARRVTWSPDGKSIYAAVAETDADVVVLDGLVR